MGSSWFAFVHLVEVVLEPVETVSPQGAIGRQPVVDLAELLRPKPIHPTLGIDARIDQPGLAQDAQVFRNRGLAELAEVLHELRHRSLAAT